MFQGLFFQERDARGDLKMHKKNVQKKQVKEVKAPPAVPNHPTRANLVGGKGLFINLHNDKQ
eukprot:CAMPEP_0172303012 /NCGR_PEP_ID=MMETSP1058-20130122/4622_1 /TAXON_ID=83371 /ORGANISM="Detonula confervacea, Strain CCMP 353" /LENGTH=61 /DNA_ID=CAMNT_0013013689 /DNA_START=151 /DNA_END=336 /DNA_ORIENTATION=-